MNIFYAVQATGNGHISRAIELLPYLKNHGNVDVFLSGTNAGLETSLPVKYRSRGLSLEYNKHGGLDYLATLQNANFRRVYAEARALPLEKYDIILNDFECITSISSKLKRKKSLQFGHQAAFHSPHAPRAKTKDILGEWVLKNYASGTAYLGLHFQPYDNQILTPVIRRDILHTTASDEGFVCIYLPQYNPEEVIKTILPLDHISFKIFSKHVTHPQQIKHITLAPLDQKEFAKSMAECTGLITGAGFETPAEALFLKKKLLVIPIHGQYEQHCNAEALKEWNVPVLEKLSQLDRQTFDAWLNTKSTKSLEILYSTEEIANKAVESALLLGT